MEGCDFMIITLTMNPAIDKSSSIDKVAPGKKLRCNPPRFEPGGGGINVSRAVHKIGGEATAYFTSGGAMGQMMQELLEKEEVPCQPLPIRNQTRENFIVFEESTDHQFRFGMPGAELSEEEWKDIIEKIATLDPAPDYVVASGSLPPGTPNNFYGLLAEKLRKKDIRVIVDTSGEPLKKAADAGVFMLKPNMRELKTLFGKDISGEEDQEEAACSLIKKENCEVMVVSLGAAGVMMVTKEECKRFRAPSVPIRSKVGAGDSMVAGIVLGLERGWSVDKSVKFGVAAGSAAVMTPGTELCRKKDAEELFEKIKSD